MSSPEQNYFFRFAMRYPVDEDSMYELFQSGIYKLDPNPLTSKEFFYERVKKVFAKDFTDENDIHKARKTFARRWLFL